MKFLLFLPFLGCATFKQPTILNAYQVEYSRHFRKVNDSTRVSEFGRTWVKRGDHYYLKP